MNPRTSLAACVAIALCARPAAAATLNVRDYASPAAAIAAAHNGDRVYFPSPGPYVVPSGGWLLSKSLELYGDGPGNETVAGASSIVPDRDGNAFVLDSTVSLSNLHLHDLLVVRQGAGSGLRAALRLTLPDAGTHTLSGLRVERVAFVNLAGDAIRLDGGARNAVLLVTLADCEVNTCGGTGVTLRHTTTTTLLNGYYHDCRGYGLSAEAAGVRVLGAAFEHDQLAGTSNDYHAQVRLKLCHGFTILGCHFEEFADAARPARTALTVEGCRGGLVASCAFVKNGAGVPGSRGVLLLGGSRDVDVGANAWTLVDTLVAVRGAGSNPGCRVRAQAPLATDVRAAGVLAGVTPGAEVPSAGGLDLVGRTGELAPLPLVTAPAAGLYRVSVYVATDAPGAGALAVRLEWNDGAARERDVISGFDLARAGATADGSCTVQLARGQALTCRTVGAGSGARWSLHARVEPL